jgi:hypothetical protein
VKFTFTFKEIELSLCLTKHNALQTNGALKEKLHIFSTFSLGVSSQLHAPSTLPTLKKPDTYWTGGWVPNRASTDAAEQIKNIFSYRGSIYDSHELFVHTRRSDQSCTA